MLAVFVLLVLVGVALAATNSESESQPRPHSRSHSKSHKSHSHSKSHRSHPQTHSHSDSPSHSDSRSHSDSPSHSVGDFKECTEMAAAPSPPYTLVFPTADLPSERETCKGEPYLHDGNAKNWITHPGLNAHWQDNRACHCSTYRTCLLVDCVTRAHTFVIHTPLLPLDTVLLGCHFVSGPGAPLPYPKSVAATLIAAGLVQPPAPGVVRCIAPGDVSVDGNFTGAHAYPTGGTGGVPPVLNCTVTISPNDGGGASAQCHTSVYRSCSPFVLPTNYSSDVDRASCSHERTGGDPKTGAGKVFGFVLAGLAGAVLLGGLAYWAIAGSSAQPRGRRNSNAGFSRV